MPDGGNRAANGCRVREPSEETVQTWEHAIKGVITGVEVGGDDTWMMVRMVGDHHLRWLSPGRAQGGGEVTHDGEVGTYRRSRMVPVEAAIVEPHVRGRG